MGVLTSVAAISAGPTHASDQDSVELAEFQSETETIIAATIAFFEAAERAAQDRSTPTTPVIGLPQAVSPVSLKASDPALEILTDHGAVQHLTAYRINWYPLSRLLGTVDYMGTWNSNRNLVCGYLSWDLSDPEAPVLEDVKANYVDLAELASASPDQVHEALLEANCAFGAIDVNFAYFEPAH